MKDQLFILRPGFQSENGPLYCGDSVSVEGMLGFFPKLRELIDVHYIEAPRPRKPVVDLIGEENQSIPVLVLADGHQPKPSAPAPKSAKGNSFYADERAIRDYLSAAYDLPTAG